MCHAIFQDKTQETKTSVLFPMYLFWFYMIWHAPSSHMSSFNIKCKTNQLFLDFHADGEEY